MPSRSTWSCVLLLAPLGVAVEVPSDSLPPSRTRVTTLSGAAGQGVYGRDIRVSLGFVEGCAGPYELTGDYYLKDEYVDAGAEPDRQVHESFHLGVRAGLIWDDATPASAVPIDPATSQPVQVEADLARRTFYIDPHFSIEGRWLGVGLGAVISDAPLKAGDFEEAPLNESLDVTPSLHIRLGDEHVYARRGPHATRPGHGHLSIPAELFVRGQPGVARYRGMGIQRRPRLSLLPRLNARSVRLAHS